MERPPRLAEPIRPSLSRGAVLVVVLTGATAVWLPLEMLATRTSPRAGDRPANSNLDGVSRAAVRTATESRDPAVELATRPWEDVLAALAERAELPPAAPALPPVAESKPVVATGPALSDVADPPPGAPSFRDRGARFGATPQTETAVDLGLAWLAAHQAPDGSWDSIDFQRHCPEEDRCGHPAIRRTLHSIRPGLTGLCMLAFLALGPDAGSTQREVIGRARDALLRQQRPDGGFGDDDPMSGYNDALATLALAELYAQSGDAAASRALPRALARIAGSQQALGGWDYLATDAAARNDTSITAWMVQALQTAAAAGFDVPRAALIRAALHFERAAEDDGRVWYSDTGEGFRLDPRGRPIYRYGGAMTACALMAETLLGCRAGSARLQMQRARLLRDLPSAARFRGRDTTQLHSEYYWYYGTVALFQSGGEDWVKWNGALRDALLPLQERPQSATGQRGHTYGSFPAYGRNWGKWGRLGGRVYTTAISVLTLATYYRHTPAYLVNPTVLHNDDWTAFCRAATVRERRFAAEYAAHLQFAVGEPLLLALLNDEDARVARTAAESLLEIDSPMGLAVLRAEHDALPPWARTPVADAIQRAEALRKRPPARGRIVQVDEALRLVIVEITPTHAGQRLVAADPLKAFGELRVLRRFDDRPRVVADWTPRAAAAIPTVGAEVESLVAR